MRRRPIVPLTRVQQHAVLASQPLVSYWVTRLRHIPAHIEKDDLCSEGTIGLMQAVQRFDPDRGVQFASFASVYIRGAILEYLRRQDPLTRSARQQRRRLEQREGSWLGDEQLQPQHLWRQVDPAPSPEDVAVTRLTAQSYLADLACLPTRSQAIFTSLVCDEAQMTAVAKDWKISRARVGQIQAVTVKAIRRRRNLEMGKTRPTEKIYS